MDRGSHIFVYGTLKAVDERFPLSVELARRSTGRKAGVFNGKLYNVGWYPAAVDSSDPTDKVYGVVYSLPQDEGLLAALDAYEGIGEEGETPDEYVRVRRSVETDDGVVSAWVYLYNWPCSGLERIASGDFKPAA